MSVGEILQFLGGIFTAVGVVNILFRSLFPEQRVKDMYVIFGGFAAFGVVLYLVGVLIGV